MKKRKKSDITELQRIQKLIPESMTKRLLIKRKVSPTIAKVVREAMKSEEMSDEKKEQFQHLIDAGMLDKTEDVENKTAVKEIEKFLEVEIAKSVIAGRLTSPKDEKVLAKYKKICRKLTKRST